MSEESPNELSNVPFLMLRKLVADIRQDTARTIKEKIAALQADPEIFPDMNSGVFVLDALEKWMDETYTLTEI